MKLPRRLLAKELLVKQCVVLLLRPGVIHGAKDVALPQDVRKPMGGRRLVHETHIEGCIVGHQPNARSFGRGY